MADPTEPREATTTAKWFWIAAIVILLLLLIYLFVSPTGEVDEVVEPADQVELEPVDPVDGTAAPPVTLPDAGGLGEEPAGEAASQ
jgi:hypothetical protein